MPVRRLVPVFVVAFGATAAPARAQPPKGEVTPPVVLSHADAIYPASAVPAGEHRDVVLAVTVDADGNVSKVEVLESGGPALDEAATTAVRQWKFRPATRDGRPIASRIRVPFHFAPLSPPVDVTTKPPAEPVVPGNVVRQSGGRGVSGPAPESIATRGPTAEAPAPPAAAEEVSVRGQARPPSRGPADFDVAVGALAAVPRASAGDLLTMAPGVFVTNEGGEGHADSIVLRGFDAGEGESMELTVGGVPINEPGNYHGNGYADTHFIVPELVESVRVIEGPYDPRQGNFAVAGSADYELGLARPGITAEYTVGSFGTNRMLATWRPEREGPHTFAAAEYAQTDGYGENRAYKRGGAIAQYEGELGGHAVWRVTGQAYSTVAQAAGVVREDDYEAGRIGFYGTYDPNQGQDSSRYSVAARVETHAHDTVFGQQLFVVVRSSRIREDFTGFVTDAGTEDPRGTGIDLGTTERSIGARGWARVRGDALGRRQEVEVGYFARGDWVDNVQRMVERTTQAPYATDASFAGALGDFGMYADASLRPLSWLTLRGGARGELFTYVVEDDCPQAPDCAEVPKPSGNPRTSAADAAFLPRASAIVGPLRGFSFVGSYGQGVRSLAIDEVSADPGAPLATIASYEGGVEYTRGTGAGALSLRSTFFGTRVSRDEVFDPTQGRVVETGATSRVGWAGAARFTGPFFDELANVTAVRGTVDATGQPVPYVPHVTARSDTALFGELPWALGGRPVRGSLGPGVSYVGPRSLPYGRSSAPYALLDAAAALEWRSLQLRLAVTNVLDVKVRLSEFNFVSDFHTVRTPTSAPELSFTAGAPRMVFVSLAGTLGG